MNRATTSLATYRLMSKKYPEFDADRLLTDLIATTPGEEGKWFATAKTPKRIDLAMLLAWKSPCDPKTLILAAGDNATRAQVFDAEVALGRSERVTLRIQTMPKPTTRELRWVGEMLYLPASSEAGRAWLFAFGLHRAQSPPSDVFGRSS